MVLWSPGSKTCKRRVKLQSGFDSDCSLTVMKGASLSTHPSTGLSGNKFWKLRIIFNDPEIPDSIDNCKRTKYGRLFYGWHVDMLIAM